MPAAYVGQDWFWNRLQITDSCWLWTGTVNEKGYGHIVHHQKLWKAHRLAWFFKNGEIPNGLCVLHRCDNPPCCNPAHLFLGTLADNHADMMSKGRGSKPPLNFGEGHNRGKLKEVDVREILRLHSESGVSALAIAKRFSVHNASIYNIIKGKSWKHLQKA